MKSVLSFTVLIVFVLTSCAPAQNATTPIASVTSLPTSTHTPIPATFTASPTLTQTSTPTLELPVGLKTPIPDLNTGITSNNGQDLNEVARYYGNMPYLARLTKDHKRLFVRDQLGIDVYDYQTEKLLLQIPLYSKNTDTLGLQISDAGDWALIDRRWLLQPDTFQTEKDLQDLYSRPELNPNQYAAEFALSPNGKLLAIHEYNCNNECFGIFHFLHLDTGEYTNAPSINGFYPVFSPDSSLIAVEVEYRVVVVHNIAENKIVGKFPIDYQLDGKVFSSDSSLIALRQRGPVEIWNLASGEKIVTEESYRADCYSNTASGGLSIGGIGFFSQDNNEIAIFRCKKDIQVWSIPQGKLLSEKHFDTDVSSTLFDDKGNISLLFPFRSTGLWRNSSSTTEFRFTDNQTIAFQYYDRDISGYRGCTVPLQSGDLNCVDNAVLGTDGNFYKYVVNKNIIQVFPYDAPSGSQLLFEFGWTGVAEGTILGLDPQHTLVLYVGMTTQYEGYTSLIDWGTGKVIRRWDQRDAVSWAASSDSQDAAFCLRTPISDAYGSIKGGKLDLVDLASQKITYEEGFTCHLVAISSSADNRRIAAGYMIIRPGKETVSSLLMIMDFDEQNLRKKVDIGCSGIMGALAFSPDDSLLVAGCDESIHFLNPSDGTEYFRLEGYPGVSGLAFSPDGKKLAISFGGGVISIVAVSPVVP
ncbi:MAG: hypothetical protein HZB50_06620 [Chloroflexi bacterium]|nr:hypothetical protein [Chloroflexota bacterium]